MKLLEVPWQVNCAVIVGTPLLAEIAKAMEWINPILLGCSYLVAIMWGCVQTWIAWKRRHG